MITISLDTAGLTLHMKEVIKRSRTLKPILEEIKPKALSQTQLRFRNTEAPDGGQWERLAESTIKRRRRGSSKPLNDTTTHILQKITAKSYKNSVAVGVYDSEDVKIAAVHNFGAEILHPARKTKINWKISKNGTMKIVKQNKANFQTEHKVKSYKVSIPERRFLGFSSYEVKKYTKMVQKYIVKGE